MGHPLLIAQANLVLVAGPPAVGLVRARRKHGAEHAMLHVEHRHLLVDDHFEPLRRHGRDQVQQLIAAQVIGSRDPLGAQVAKILHRQFVGGIEREVGHEGDLLLSTKIHAGQVAGEDPVRLVPQDRRKQARFLRLLNPRRGQQDRRFGGMGHGNGLAVVANVAEVGQHAPHARIEHRPQLVERTAQYVEHRHLAPSPFGRWQGWETSLFEHGAFGQSSHRRPSDEGVKLLDHLTPQLAQHAQRDHRRADEAGVHGA